MNKFVSFKDAYLAYKSLLEESFDLCFMSCKTAVQVQICSKIKSFLQEDSYSLRLRLAAEPDEDGVRKLLTLDSQLAAIFYEMQCLICLKSDQAKEAWDHLVAAQECVKTIGKLHGHAEEQFQRLRTLESIFFPRQTFMSAGIIVKESLCNICTSSYEECDHILGEIYGSQICCRTIIKCDLLEVSYLGHGEPKDRRCRVTHLTENGVKLDLLTREIESTIPSIAMPDQ